MSVSGFMFKNTVKVGGMTARGALRVAAAAGNDVMVGLQEGKQQLEIECKKTAELYAELQAGHERKLRAAQMMREQLAAQQTAKMAAAA